MEFNATKHWNKSHLGHPKDKEKLFPRGSIVCDLGGGDGNVGEGRD